MWAQVISNSYHHRSLLFFNSNPSSYMRALDLPYSHYSLADLLLMIPNSSSNILRQSQWLAT